MTNPAITDGTDRIHVPTGHAVEPAGPTLLGVFAREAWKRKRLVAAWAALTAVAVLLVVGVLSKPLYRAEGRMTYRPNFARGAKPIYTPPNIQSAVQIVKTADVYGPVRERRVPGMSADDFAAAVRIEVSKQSEFIDVTFDHRDPGVAAAVANDLMAEALKHFNKVRVEGTREAIGQLTADLANAKRRHASVREEYAKAHEAKGVPDMDLEQESLRSAQAGIEGQLLTSRLRQGTVKAEIKHQEARRDAPLQPGEIADESYIVKLQVQMSNLQANMANDGAIKAAQIEKDTALMQLRERAEAIRLGAIPKSEVDDLKARIKRADAILSTASDQDEVRKSLQKQLDEMKAQQASGKPIRKAVIEELDRLRKEESTLPATIETLEAEKAKRKKELAALLALKRELSEKDDAVKLAWSTVQDYQMQVTDASERTKGLNDNDMQAHAAAVAPSTPFSTNGPKLAMALVGVSGLLLIAYLAIFALPTLAAQPGSALATGPRLPRALVALVPYIPKPRTPSPALVATPAKEPTPDVRELANRIAPTVGDTGSVVLFAPTREELRVGPVMGDLGEYLTRRGEKVLVFDARSAVETPDWAGPGAPAVAACVDGYLDGGSDAAGCFVTTQVNGVEYSRADLSGRMGSGAARVRQLVGEMRDRYSLVFLVTPPMGLEAADSLLATLAEGMVLVTETAADPVEVHAYLDTLCQQVPTRLYGTLEVPRA